MYKIRISKKTFEGCKKIFVYRRLNRVLRPFDQPIQLLDNPKVIGKLFQPLLSITNLTLVITLNKN